MMIQCPPESHKTAVKTCGELFPTAVQKRNEEKAKKKGDRPLFLRFLRQKEKRIRDVNFED
jgi:hypothetical protein